MSGHVHIDVEGNLNSLRHMLAVKLQVARENARTARDVAHIDAQAHFHEILITASRLKMEAENLGFTKEQIAKAMGIVCGTVQAQNLLNFIAEGTGMEYQTRYMRTVEALTLGELAGHEHAGTISVQTMQGSRA